MAEQQTTECIGAFGGLVLQSRHRKSALYNCGASCGCKRDATEKTAPLIRSEAVLSGVGGDALSWCLKLDAVIHVEFDRVRRVLEAIHFFPFQFEIGVDLVIVHHAAFFQEVAIGVEGFQRFAQ